MSFPNPYVQYCSDGCGCCVNLDEDLENSGSFFMPESAQEVDCGDTDL